MHPCHHAQLPRLKRIAGQLNGIIRMIEEQRYCIDILTQTKAVTAAVKKVEQGILKNHISHCLKDAAASDNDLALQEKVDELMSLLEKRI